MGLTILFISHDLSVIANLCDWVCVMKHGDLVEQGNVRDIFLNPQQPYTRQLIASIPLLERREEPADAPEPVSVPANGVVTDVAATTV